jgi:hypothetical protein
MTESEQGEACDVSASQLAQPGTPSAGQLVVESLPLGPETRETVLSVEVSEHDLLGLQALATVAGVGERDSGSFAQLLSSTLHRGVIESYKAAGLSWPANPAALAVENRRGAVEDSRAGRPPSFGSRVQAVRRVAFGAAGFPCGCASRDR